MFQIFFPVLFVVYLCFGGPLPYRNFTILCIKSAKHYLFDIVKNSDGFKHQTA